ncbi:hypothetical protein [Promicromonospora sp. NPDC050262]|uniref:hypothetical protein n=1 Tax=Promicromonospora sp. NPDC050262 TaxID=3155036 RepID=UPI0033D036E3
MTISALPDLADFPGVALSESDGVPVLLAPREGNLGAGIVFRVGTAHETLATSGITHLVEHLALRGQVLSEAHLNGQTHADVTVFHVAGSVHDVVSYLNDVCASLQDLPLDQIETEKDILRSEAEGRNPGFGGALRVNRHGARGYGLAGYGERGLDRITPAEVRQWAARMFTRENAVAWVTADALPAGLDLSLPSGERMYPPAVTDVLQGTPAYLSGLRDGVSLDALVPRGYPALLATGVVREVLHRDLRRSADIAQSLSVSYDHLDDELARVSVVVRAAEGRQDAAAGGLADALGGLRFHVTEDDLAAAREGMLEEMAEAAAAPAADLLPSLAYRMVTGRDLDGSDQARAAVEQVSANDVLGTMREVWGSALWYGPAPLDWAGMAPAPEQSPALAKGRSYPRIDVPDVSLVIGPDGVGSASPDGVVTVLFADCVLMETVPDGARVLTGADGFRVVIEPTLYRSLTVADIAASVDRHVPEDVVVHHPARAPQDIPVAVPPKKAGKVARSVWGTIERLIALWFGVFVLFVVAELIARELFGAELRLGFLPLLVLVATTVQLLRKRHGKGER